LIRIEDVQQKIWHLHSHGRIGAHGTLKLSDPVKLTRLPPSRSSQSRHAGLALKKIIDDFPSLR